MDVRKTTVDRDAQSMPAAAINQKKADTMRQPLLPFQFFQPAVLDDVIDNLILKNVRKVLNNIAAGNFFVRKINYKKLALALSIEHGEAMRKKILGLLLDHAELTPKNLRVKHLPDMLARHALIEALPFLNEKEQQQVVKALINLYAKLYATRPYFDVEEFLLNPEDWKCFLKLIDKACREDLELCEVFFSKFFLAWIPLLSTDNLVSLLPLIQQAIIESTSAGEGRLELFRAANKALNDIQPRIPRAALLARGIQPLHVAPAPPSAPAVAPPSLDTLLNAALNDKDQNVDQRRRHFNVICSMMNAANHHQVIQKLWLNMQNKSGGAFVDQYCMLFAKAFEFASAPDREKIKSNLLAFLKAQADVGRISIVEHVKKIMRYMPEQERLQFVKAAIGKINTEMLASTNCRADEKTMVALDQKASNLAALELLREYQIIREAQRRALDNQLATVLQDVLSHQQDVPVLPKPVTAIAAVYTKRF